MVGGYDVVVVGAGPAGCVTARTAAEAGARVLIIEGGPRPTAMDRPVEIQAALARHGRRGIGARRNPLQPISEYAAGWGVGGGALVNGLLLMGASVPPMLRIASAPGESPLSKALREAADRIGYRRARSERARYLGTGTERADLGELLVHPGIEVRTHTPVDRVARSRDGTAIGVQDVGGNVTSASVVVLSTGTIETPRMLWRSGVVDSSIGQGVSDHPSWMFALHGVETAASPFADSVVLLTPGADHDEFLVTSYGSTLLLTRLRSTGMGRVLPALIESRMAVEDDELRATQVGLAAFFALVNAAGLQASGPDGSPLAEVVQLSNLQQRRWLAQHENGTYHATGSCLGVVDRHGWVPAVPSLRIVDASVLSHVPFPPLASVLAHAAAAAWDF